MRLYIDSSVLLQFRPLDEIKWRALLDESPREIELIIVPAVLREIEEKKVGANRRLSKRADRVIQQLERLIPSDKLCANIRDGILLRIHTEEPRNELRESGLNASVWDDWILATVLEDTSPERALVTDDIGLGYKARAMNIRVIRPPENSKLPPEEDEDLRKLREENRALKQQLAKQPALELTFSNGQKILQETMSIPSALTAADLDRLVEERREKLLKDARFAVYMRARTHVGIAGHSEINIESLDSYLARWRAFRLKKHQRDVFIQSSREIWLSLSNSGQAPALGIEISIQFPQEVILGEDPDLLEEPSEPLSPNLIANNSLFNRGDFGLADRPDLTSQVNSIWAGLTASHLSERVWRHSRDGHCISMRIERLLQTQIANLQSFWLAFPYPSDMVSAFSAEYRILVFDPADVLSGTLSFAATMTDGKT